MAAILIMIAVLALTAGFYILYSGRRSSKPETPADHKVKIRKASSPAQREVNDDPPEGLSAIESAALEQEEEDPIDIFLDMDLPFEYRLEAEDKLKDAGFKIHSSLRDNNSPNINHNKNESDVDVHDTATDEVLELTGE